MFSTAITKPSDFSAISRLSSYRHFEFLQLPALPPADSRRDKASRALLGVFPAFALFFMLPAKSSALAANPQSAQRDMRCDRQGAAPTAASSARLPIGTAHVDPSGDSPSGGSSPPDRFENSARFSPTPNHLAEPAFLASTPPGNRATDVLHSG